MYCFLSLEYYRDFALVKKNSQSNQNSLSLTFTKAAGYLTLLSNNKRDFFSMPSSFDGKKLFYGWQKVLIQLLQKLT